MDHDGATHILPEAIPSYLDLHSTLPTQAGAESKRWHSIPPSHPLTSTGPIQFDIPSGAEQQILPSGIRVVVRVRILHADGSALGPYTDNIVPVDARVIPVNGIGHALFSDIEVRLNDQKIASNDGMYAYRGNLDNILFTSAENKKNSCLLSGFEMEDVRFDSCRTQAELKQLWAWHKETEKDVLGFNTAPYNNGKVWGRRYLATAASREKTYYDRLYSEIFQQPLALPPQAKLTIQLQRSQPNFCLLAGEGKTAPYRIEISRIELVVPFISVDKDWVRDIYHETFRDREMRFPMRRVEMTSYEKNLGAHELNIDSIQFGTVAPRRIFVALVASAAKSGDYQLDPFNYQHFNVSEIFVKVGGQQSSAPSYEMDFERLEFTQPLFYLLNTLGSEGSDSEIGINPTNYLSGNVIYAFDVNGLAGVELDEAYTREMRAPTGLSIKLKTPLTAAATVLVYKEYDAEMTMDRYNTIRIHPYA
jgi:hypothetical protein